MSRAERPVAAEQHGEILIVEDDPGTAALERRRLERVGYATRIARTAEEALTELRRSAVDLMLLDYHLPGDVDGLDFYGRARAAGFDVPVILITGFSNETMLVRALRSGVRDFLAKSVEFLDYLPETVERVLRQVRTERQLAESEARLATIIQSARDAILIAEADLRISLMNQAAETMFRCPVAQGVGQPLSYFLPEELGTSGLRARGAAGTPFVSRGLRQNGEDFPVEATVGVVQLPGRTSYTVVVRDVSERRRAEEALRTSEERYRVLTEVSPQAVWLTEADGQLTYWNRWCLDYTGLTMTEAAGEGWTQCIHPNHRERILTLWREAVRTGENYEVEIPFQRASDGAYRWHLCRGQPLRDATGRIIQWIGIALDIHERKQTEEELQRFKLLSEYSSDAHFLVDGALGIAYVNERACTQLGYTRTELLKLSIRDIDLNWEPSNTEAAFESIQRRKDGTTLPVEVRITVVNSGSGQLFWAVRDISERKKAEEQIREQASLLDEARDAIVLRDVNDNILYWNRGAERLYGWTAAEAVGQNAGLLLYRGPSSERDLAQRTALEKGEWTGELKQITRAGKEVIVESRRTLLRDEQGRPRAKLIINTDITEKKSLETQFLQAQKMETLGLLAGGVAHDFNNLLTAISGFSEMLLGLPHLPEPAPDMIRQIHRAGERAAALTRQLLAFSRRQILQPIPLDLNSLLGETEKMLERLVGADIDLAYRLDPTLELVLADPGQIEMVLINLAVNARDAMPQGGKLTLETRNVEFDEAYCRTHTESRPGPFVLLAVSDMGVGMDEATRTRIFEPFFTTKQPGKGTGLGLASVYGIIKQSGGFIRVYSEPGQGTTFNVYLPRVHQPVQPDRPPSGQFRLPRGTETILLAEDEDSVRRVASQTLQTLGYTVLTARDGNEALAMAAEHEGPIDLLATDVVMPGLGGRQLADWFRQARPRARVLFLSGYADDAIVRHGKLEPGAAFLHKPFTPSSLSRKVREVLDGPA